MAREGRRRRPWLLVLVALVVLLLASALTVGLPGSGQLQVTVRMAGGPADLSGNSLRQTLARVEIRQTGRTVRRLTVPAGRRETLSLRPGLYEVDVTNISGCRASSFVRWGSVKHLDIICSVK
jgi:hypothetical protein